MVKYTIKKFLFIFAVIFVSCLVYSSAWIFFQPIALVAPHHNLVADVRNNLYQKITSLRPQTSTIILLSPDHFSPNQNNISYSDISWNLSNGALAFDDQTFSSFKSDLILNTPLLRDDHGIYNQLPDLKRHFPSARIVPILIGQKVPKENLSPLLEDLKNNCRYRCLLVASVDFSHYLPAALADVHDRKSLRVLHNQQLDEIFDLEVDSPQSLYLLTAFSSSRIASRWQLFAHTNSGFISQNPETETTTHILGYYSPTLHKFSPDTTTTFIYTPTLLDRQVNQSSLGDRFFYGVDDVKTSLPQNLHIPLPNNFILAGFTSSAGTQLYFLPTHADKQQHYFTRGQARTTALEKLLSDPYFTELSVDKLYGSATFNSTFSVD